ncbi:MAG: hypothetical protein WCB67_13865, partial [Solirubrobacteraceae bacterium]
VWLLVFGGVTLVSLMIVVVAMNIRTPFKLQLGEVTGRELMEYEQMTLGNSTSGEYVESVLRAIVPGAGPSPQPPESATPEGDEREGT